MIENKNVFRHFMTVFNTQAAANWFNTIDVHAIWQNVGISEQADVQHICKGTKQNLRHRINATNRPQRTGTKILDIWTSMLNLNHNVKSSQEISSHVHTCTIVVLWFLGQKKRKMSIK